MVASARLVLGRSDCGLQRTRNKAKLARLNKLGRSFSEALQPVPDKQL